MKNSKKGFNFEEGSITCEGMKKKRLMTTPSNLNVPSQKSKLPSSCVDDNRPTKRRLVHEIKPEDENCRSRRK